MSVEHIGKFFFQSSAGWVQLVAQTVTQFWMPLWAHSSQPGCSGNESNPKYSTSCDASENEWQNECLPLNYLYFPPFTLTWYSGILHPQQISWDGTPQSVLDTSANNHSVPLSLSVIWLCFLPSFVRFLHLLIMNLFPPLIPSLPWRTGSILAWRSVQWRLTNGTRMATSITEHINQHLLKLRKCPEQVL